MLPAGSSGREDKTHHKIERSRVCGDVVNPSGVIFITLARANSRLPSGVGGGVDVNPGSGVPFSSSILMGRIAPLDSGLNL